jgi:hypothetical protein
MEEDLRQLIAKCSPPTSPHPLTEADISRLCSAHGIRRQELFAAFARHVAQEFAAGSLSFWSGNYAMNALGGVALEELEGFPLEVFYAFDHGEYPDDGDPRGAVPWQRHTLPQVMEALEKEGLSPSA